LLRTFLVRPPPFPWNWVFRCFDAVIFMVSFCLFRLCGRSFSPWNNDRNLVLWCLKAEKGADELVIVQLGFVKKFPLVLPDLWNNLYSYIFFPSKILFKLKHCKKGLTFSISTPSNAMAKIVPNSCMQCNDITHTWTDQQWMLINSLYIYLW